MEALAKAWPHARAAFIALLMAIALIDGCPLAPIERVPPGLAHDFNEALVRAQLKVIRSLRLFEKGFRWDQNWKLFPVARRDRYRMWLEGQTASGEWVLLFRAHDDAHTRFGNLLEYRRIRGSWNPGSRGPRGAYDSFVTWIARQVFLDEVTIQKVRVRMEKVRIRSRGRGFEPSGTFAFAQERTRQGVLK